MIFKVLLVCAHAFSWSDLPVERYGVCVGVGTAAIQGGVNIELAVALAYTESRFNPAARSPRDAVGPLQIRPVFHCPGKTEKGCDLIKAGIEAIIRYQDKYGPRLKEVLCHWNSGNRCYRRSRLFANIVLKRKRALVRAQEK